MNGGSIAQWLPYLPPDLDAPGLIPSIPKKIQRKKMLMTLLLGGKQTVA